MKPTVRKTKPALFSSQTLSRTFEAVARGRLSSEEAFRRFRNLPYETLGCARIDHHRRMRKGIPEAVYASGKSFGQLCAITERMKRSGEPLLITRLDGTVFRKLKRRFCGLRYSETARLAYWNTQKAPKNETAIVVISAGTSDIPVAEEAALTLEILGKNVVRIFDCGVAGLHRLADQIPVLEKAKAVICVAGMEGALPGVVAGLVSAPVIAVPTSVGYGAHLGGFTALFAMLTSCAQGISVVNIDNGFGAACFAALIK
ncbi:MAG TPA: nickel pincer cofactor biosynthesis protein LarB [Candidatus Omnitrophota bacterium]|nr:nickel pincer cofactor biosynthesis protein LarB [Candidatus Omnitrophota bacterium]